MRAFLPAATLAALAACGGNVVLDQPSGGAGGFGGSPSSGQLATTHAATTGFGASGTGASAVATTGFGASGVGASAVATTGFGASGVGGDGASIVAVASTSNVAVATSDASSAVTGFFDAGDPCSTGADCSQCMSPDACSACTATAHPAGVHDYNDLASCVICTACYTTCNGAQQNGFCGPQGPMDPCDVTGFPNTQCGNCQQCAVASTCKSSLDTCMSNPDCLAILNPQCG